MGMVIQMRDLHGLNEQLLFGDAVERSKTLYPDP